MPCFRAQPGDSEAAEDVRHRSASRGEAATAPAPGVFDHLRRRPKSYGAVAASCALLLFQAGLRGQTNSGRRVEAKTPVYANTVRGVGYVGSGACATCHANIYEKFMTTDMGRSMALASGPAQMEKVSAPVTIHDEKFNRYFQVFRRDSSLYQSEYELGPDGREVFTNTQKIAYAMGSGANGISYIVRQGDYLLQAPLSYYSKSRSWALSPGYELGDYGFSRTIPAGCIVCHSGLAQPVPNRYGLYRDPPFRELGIGCENCHGPGQLHVEERTNGAPLSGRSDATIVNPARLPGWLADNICMNCHQGGDTRILQPGRDYYDFRPATALDTTVAIFALPLSRESPPASPLLEHYSLMVLSQCYRRSGGRMSCLTCHDPHEQPRSDAAGYYRKRCLSCHAETSCSVPVSARARKAPPDDCAGCHMLRQNLTLISHSALTNHRIVAYEGEPYPEAAFHETSPELPDLVHVNAVPGAKDAVSPLVLLQAYGELMSSHPQYRERYLGLLNQLAETAPDNPLVRSGLAWSSIAKGTPEGREEAIRYLAQVVASGSAPAADYESLGELLGRSGRTEQAITTLQRGIHLYPYENRLYKSLALLCISAHRYSDALDAMKKELAIFPEDDFMRMLVKKAQAAPSSPP